MGRRTSWLGILCLALALVGGGSPSTRAQSIAPINRDDDTPVLLRADTLTYDQEQGIVTATGNVEASREGRILLADSLSFNQRADTLSATGHVSLLEPTGEVVFAEHVELSGDFKNGIVEDIRMILSDGARIAAAGARRTDGTVHEMRNAVYSPCNLCADNPNRAPLWQVKAVRVTQNQNTHDVVYEDAWLEIRGIPVAYTPFLSHPDPTVRRRSGFLTPSIGNSSDLGFVTRIPYFFDLSPSQDITLTPIYTSEEGPVLAGEYRELARRGELKMSGSITHDSNEEVRGHISGKGRFDLTDTWRTGFDLSRSTDDTYLRRYRFPSSKTLTSRVYAEGFRKRNYFSASAYSFQGLQETDDPGESPLVLPMLEYHHVGEPGKFGARTRLDANMLALTRSDGNDTQRLSVNAGWDLPYTGPMGDVYTLSASLRGDVYHVTGLERSDGGGKYSGFDERLVPEIAMHWRYPFVRNDATIVQQVEPIVSVIASPNAGNPSTIPNEDSQDFEFDDTNLFSDNRFPGLDRVEGGPRVNYGLRWGAYGAHGGRTSVLVGQSARLHSDDSFAEGSGLDDHLSDIVARAMVSPGQYLNLVYRTRLDKEDFDAKRHEASIATGPASLQFSGSYVFFERQPGSEFATSREEVRSSLLARLDRYWRTLGSAVYDIEESDPRSFSVDLIYEDECLYFSTSLSRTFYQDRDLEPTDSIFFRIGFKTLGEITTDLF